MDDARSSVLQFSEKVLARLKLLSVFFGEASVLRIYARTQVIHNSFRDNPELDINKLELFHLQFTDTIVDLLRKIKKGNENRVLQGEDEIRVNEDLIRSLSDATQLEHTFGAGAEGHALALDKAMNTLYENLSDYSRDNPFPKALREFSDTFAKDFFYEVSPALFDSFFEHDPARTYRNGYGAIEKKLMGLQCKHRFKNTFHCGIKAGARVAEVFRLRDFIVEDDDHEFFVFDPARNLLLGAAPETVAQIPAEGATSKKAQTIFALQETNARLQRSLPLIKTEMPEGVRGLLDDYLRRIEGIDFLEMIDRFDIQANILKTMLNTDI
jgi:hypothetical protein